MTRNSSPNVTFLLGAGASVDAGLPVSVELTKTITQRLADHWSGRSVAQALHVAIGAIVAHDTARGKSAYAGIDVERIFASIRMLGRRDDHELTPFVAAWNGGVDSLGTQPKLPGFWGKNFKEEILKDDRFGHRLEEQFKEGVVAIANSKDSTEIYRNLEQQMIESLVTALAVSPDRVGYLAPLVLGAATTKVQIATLNYDNSVELLAEQQGLDLDTGIQNWAGGYDWKWRAEADVQLLKLHGSLDWRLAVRKSADERIAVDKVVVGQAGEDQKMWGSNMGVVFGQGSKLRADGPFLAMLIEFDRFLASTDHLVVVGYSMRDEHINAALRRWVSSHPDGKISIVDPGFPSLELYRDEVPFRKTIIDAFSELSPTGTPRFPRTLTPNIQIIRKGAQEGLPEVFETSLPGIEVI